MNVSLPLVVFDLDFTLWDADGLWCDCTQPPYLLANEGRVLDSTGREIRFYEDVYDCLQMLEYRGILVALASRTDQPSWADQLTKLLGIDPFVSYRQIYPGSKIKHLNQISNESGVPLSSFLFFDDELRNIRDANSIGVRAIHVTNGIRYDMVLNALM